MVLINNEGSALVSLTHSGQTRADRVQDMIHTHVCLVCSVEDVSHRSVLVALPVSSLQMILRYVEKHCRGLSLGIT